LGALAVRRRQVRHLAIADIIGVLGRHARLAFFDQLRGHARIADRGDAALDVEGANLVPGLAAEGQAALQPEHEAGAFHLADRRQVAALGETVEAFRRFAAVALRAADAIAEQNAAAGLIGDRLENVAAGAHGLHQRTARRHRLADRHQLGRVREGAGYRAPVRRLVRRKAVGRESDRAVRHGLAHDLRHLRLLVVARLLGERALAHHVVAHGAVADEAGDIDAGLEL